MSTTSKLSKTQTEVLTQATYRPSGSIEPMPSRLNRLLRAKITAGLLARGLITAQGDDYVINDAGYEAVGRTRKESAPVTPDPEPEAAVAADEASAGQVKQDAPANVETPKPKLRDGTKQAQVIALLSRPSGATLAEICSATNWQVHTTRGALAGALKKKLGLTITSTKEPGSDRCYRVQI